MTVRFHKRTLVALSRMFCALVGICVALGHAEALGQDAPGGIAPLRGTSMKPIVIAHRGASGYLPEHTTEAAAFAHALGADYIEQDVVLTKDGTPVVLHDVTLQHVTNVSEKFPDRVAADGSWYVWDFNLAELRQLSVTERRSTGRFPAGHGQFQIATLAEHIELIDGLNQSRTHSAGFYIELKAPARHAEQGLDPTAALVDILRRYQLWDGVTPVYIQCFELTPLQRLREEFSCPLPLVFLSSTALDKNAMQNVSAVCDGIGLNFSAVIDVQDSAARPNSQIPDAHRAGLDVHLWTFRTDRLPDWCSDQDELLNLLIRDAGADGIFTDQPDAVVQWRRTALGAAPRGNVFHLLNERRR